MQDDKLEAILELLEPHNNPNIPITPSALRRLELTNLDTFYKFLTSPLKKSQNGVPRPECPVKDIKHSSLARYSYKRGMADYIAQWGYEFKNPANITSSLLEATANYLEK